MAAIGSFGLDVGVYGRLATPDAILGLAQLAEDLGFDSVWVADHVAFPVRIASRYPYSAGGEFPADLAAPLMEPIATMGVLAGATRRVRIGTAVLVLPYRHPVLLARMLVTLDNLSRGRIVLGAGAGWLAEEFAVLGAPDFAKRGRASDEWLEIFKAVCAGGSVAYRGEVYRFDAIHAAPGSVQRPHPPILVGGLADAALDRAARLGNGWLAVTIAPAAVAGRLDFLRRRCAAHGRDFAEMALVYKMFLSIGEARRSRFDAREPGTGSVDQIVDDLKALSDLGFTRIVIRHRGEDATAQRTQIERFAAEIVPRV